MNAIEGNVSGVQGDVAQLADLERLYETVAKVRGQIDIVFANAGVGEFVPFGDVTEEDFDKLFNINVRGALFTGQKALPLFRASCFVLSVPREERFGPEGCCYILRQRARFRKRALQSP